MVGIFENGWGDVSRRWRRCAQMGDAEFGGGVVDFVSGGWVQLRVVARWD